MLARHLAGTYALLAPPFELADALTHEFSGFVQSRLCVDGVFAAIFQAAIFQAAVVQGGLLAQAGPEVSPIQVFFNSPLPLFAGLAMIWYLTWFLPEKRKRQDEARLLASITKNDRVVTIGGLHGTVVSAAPDSDVITLKIDEAGVTRVKINRSAISAITVHAKGKMIGKDGKTGGDESNSKKSENSNNAADEDSSD